MKTLALSILLSVAASAFSFAQNSILAGKIVDENNNPVPCALVKITTGREAMEVKADNDGLYNTPLLPAGGYFVSIYLNGQCYTAGEVNIAAANNARSYYTFRLTGKQAVVSIDKQSPFMAAKLARVQAKQANLDVPVGHSIFRIRYDTATGKPMQVYASPEHTPR